MRLLHEIQLVIRSTPVYRKLQRHSLVRMNIRCVFIYRVVFDFDPESLIR